VKRGWLFGLASLAVGACASGPGTPPPLPPPAPVLREANAEEGVDEPGFADLFGTYEHVGGEEDVTARDAAIEATVEGVFFLGRGLAREKLLVAAAIDDRIVVKRQGGTIEVALGERFDLKAPLDGPGTTFVGTDGDELTLTFSRQGSRLIQLAEGERGGTRRVFSLTGDGRLLVQVTIYSARLDKPVEYALHYARVD